MTDQDKIDRLKGALLETGLMNERFIEWIADGSIDPPIVRAALNNLNRAMHPPTPLFQMRYVLGFVFDAERVLLIHKKRPAWQAGLLNGVGGKIEPGETPLQAMEREFREETGLAEPMSWRFVGRRFRQPLFDAQPRSYEMFVFAAQVQDLFAFKYVMTDEPLQVVPLKYQYIKDEGVPGLVWTVNAAWQSLDENFHFSVEDPMDVEGALLHG